MYLSAPTRLCIRHFCSPSARTTPSLSPTHPIYVSASTNPFFNLSLEDWLFRHAPAEDPLLLLYRDDPCVVVGRNQNPWKEVNMHALRTTGVPFLRRHSGGGTVYHDLGNTNFSIHLPRASFDRHATGQIILRAVRSLGIDAHVNDRNDICVGKDKVSGSAYKIVNKRAYHHGTMLISTRLDTLGDLLRVKKDGMVTKGVASVRSPVCNLRLHSSSVSHDGFAHAVVTEFRKEYGIDAQARIVEETDEILAIDHIRNGMTELPSWQWAYGQTPEFTYKLHHSFAWGTVNAQIHSKHGIILSSTFESEDPALDERLQELSKALEGQKYGFAEPPSAFLSSEDTQCKDIWRWLVRETTS